jgi:hypothetical protein
MIIRALFCLFTLLAACTTPLGFANAQSNNKSDFSRQVAAVTGDWEAEDWKAGSISLHPDMFTWQSDSFLRLLPEEPVANRTPTEVLRGHFEPMTIEKQQVDFSDINQATRGVALISHSWKDSYDDDYIGFWGVITTPNSGYVPFASRCRTDDKNYSREQCIQKISLLFDAIRDGVIKVPEPPTPITVSGYDASYGTDGYMSLVNKNYNGTAWATVRVSPAISLTPAQFPEAIAALANSMVDDMDDADDDPGTVRWVGTEVDPWIRREFPKSVFGHSIIMAGTARLPDGRYSLIGVRCPGQSWMEVCAYGVDQAKFHVSTGQLEKRRVALVGQRNTPLPANGIRSDQILGIYSKGEVNGTVFGLRGFLLLKDGTAFADADVAPQSVDVAQSKRDDPEKWGRWRRAGGTILINWDDGGTDELDGGQGNLRVGGNKSTRLSGDYGTISSSGNLISGSGFVSRSNYQFFPDGTFINSRSSSFAVGAFLPGSDTIGPTQVASGGGNSTTGRARYEIDGYMLTLTYPDGQIERKSFSMHAKDANNPNREYIFIDGTQFTLDLEK